MRCGVCIYCLIYYQDASFLHYCADCILRRNCLLKHVIEGKIEGTERGGRRHKQLLEGLNQMRR
jgi:hypothetical protein